MLKRAMVACVAILSFSSPAASDIVEYVLQTPGVV